ncbi:App1 family protein [Pseudozobellia thermophila]|uniref:Phosphatidate phosphatase APP1 n=1 Tax=Pseudozobellia thermophila TaxID=192903 RepID=A0A1M6JFT5_9FLAO|nr:phosphatase domain-containing protein [Pseudozobellia thermophila]SHJ45568.1 Phosphatidate phosphatase APP1 [Pseudozobellia thermophila]
MTWFGKKDKLQIIAFQGYGTDSHFYARGRALEDEGIDLAQKGIFNLVLNTYKRFETDEVRHTPVTITLPDGRTVQGKTDNSGYYKLEGQCNNLRELTNGEGWLNFEISFSDPGLKRDVLYQNRFPGEMLIPSSKAKFGVISDIDDTILHTGVVSSLKWKVIFNTVFKTADKRTPLAGAAEFYQLLHRGRLGNEANPLFYVSHSPWNLYRYLEMFLQKNNFPKGPILLRSFPLFGKWKSPKEKPQKQKEILNILKTYPGLRFILIGDSGEYDADIYKEIAQQHPQAILAIYLRSVAHKKKMQRVKSVFKDYDTTPVLLVESTEQAIEHAKKNGFI